jgi:hypothetical protein
MGSSLFPSSPAARVSLAPRRKRPHCRATNGGNFLELARNGAGDVFPDCIGYGING